MASSMPEEYIKLLGEKSEKSASSLSPPSQTKTKDVSVNFTLLRRLFKLILLMKPFSITQIILHVVLIVCSVMVAVGRNWFSLVSSGIVSVMAHGYYSHAFRIIGMMAL